VRVHRQSQPAIAWKSGISKTWKSIRYFLWICLLFAAAAGSPAVQAAPCEKKNYKIVLDVGHTEDEPGATSARGVKEYKFNLDLTRDIAAALSAAGFESTDLLITEGKGGAALHSRPAYANRKRADLFLSIHHDSVQRLYLKPWIEGGRAQNYSDEFSGYSLFVSNRNPRKVESLAFATLLGDELQSRGLQFTAHHAENIKGERKTFLDAKRGIYRYDQLVVLKESMAPAILLEAGVIVNRSEEIEAASPARRKAIADAVVSAVNRFCGT